MDLQHISVKLFAEAAAGFDQASLIPIFHRWIQRRALSDVMMLDVADYSHVPQGPGVMLICHEGHYAMDVAGGELGLLYANKRLAAGSLTERFAAAIARVRQAARMLEAASELAGKVRFSADRWRFRVDDLLLTPNTAEAFEAVAPGAKQALEAALGGAVELSHVDNPKTGLTMDARAMAAA